MFNSLELEMKMSCGGFDENLVLSIKKSFFEVDIRQIIICLQDGKAVFHHRDCIRKSFVPESEEDSRCAKCRDWFNSILQGNQIQSKNRNIGKSSKPGSPERPADTELQRNDETNDAEEANKDKADFSCDFCDRQFRLKDSLSKHLRRQHRQSINQKRSSREGKFSCQFCGLKFDKKHSLYKHTSRKHAELKNVTRKDTTNMSTKSEQDRKVTGSLKEDTQFMKSCKRKFVCEFCGVNIQGVSSYQFHISGHTQERKYKCTLCSKSYRISSEKYNCERGHRDIFKWRCDLCSFKSHQRNKYVRHLRIHSKSKPYYCPCCSYTTSRKDYLQKHVLKDHCSSTVSLADIESLHPGMYLIKENIIIKPSIKYSKDDLCRPPPLSDENVPKSFAVDMSCRSVDQEISS